MKRNAFIFAVCVLVAAFCGFWLASDHTDSAKTGPSTVANKIATTNVSKKKEPAKTDGFTVRGTLRLSINGASSHDEPPPDTIFDLAELAMKEDKKIDK